jgi:hypothetical protein
MRKAISFFIITTIAYFFALGFSLLLNIGLPVTTSGISAIAIGLFYFIFPIEFLNTIGFFIKTPVFLLIILGWLILGLLLIAVCLVEIGLPLVIGYFLITAFKSPSVVYFIGIIAYLAIWVAFRKKYVELILDTWYGGIYVIEKLMTPLAEFLRKIDHYVHALYFWMKRRH